MLHKLVHAVALIGAMVALYCAVRWGITTITTEFGLLVATAAALIWIAGWCLIAREMDRRGFSQRSDGA
jgi:Co/Zn/Cd efflux system component